ncbi:MAG TPA: hypothetical protein VFH44_09975 [Solirubrobacterales bacterium]|nr:hypothetical protein [Solirubrobacterales bacterium]
MNAKRWLLPCACALTMLATTASASAERSTYPPDQDAVSLRNGAAGWTSDTSSEGLCVPVLLCPAIDNSIEGSGGPGGSGHLRTALGSLTGVGATSIGTFIGPSFTYRGVDGNRADDLLLRLNRRADVAALLSVAGNDATYSVGLENRSGGTDLELVNGSGLEGAAQWSQVPAVDVDPAQLQVGDRYRIVIASRFESGVQVLPGGYADYASVRLIAKREPDKQGGGSGGSGGGGGGVTNEADLIGGVIGGTVKVKGKHLSFRVRCAKRAPGKCRSRLQARLSRRGARLTKSKSVRIRPGAKRVVKLKIRKRYRERVADRKRIVIKRKTRVGGKKRTTYRTARVRG